YSKSKSFTMLLSAGIITSSICLPVYGDIAVPGSGIGQSGVAKELRMVYNPNDGKYYLRNTVDNIETFFGYGGSNTFNPDFPESPSNCGPTFGATFSHTSNFFESTCNSDETDPDILYQKAAVDAHSNVTKIVNFFKNAPFYRNNQEGSGAGEGIKLLISSVGRYEPAKPMAWGSKNYIGINNYPGKNGKTLSSCLDALAHEYTHGMLEFEGLVYSGEETVALHEGIADVFGILSRYYIANEYSFNQDGSDDALCGLIGKDIFNNGYLRDAFNPECTTYDIYKAKDDKSGLYGCGLISRAAGLMANGGPNIPAIGYGKIVRIFYDAINDGYLTENTSLQEFANYALLSSSLLYGVNSQEYQSTKAAFTAVGLLRTSPKDFDLYANNDSITLTWNESPDSTVGIFRKASGTKAKPLLIQSVIGTNQCTLDAFDGSSDYYVAFLNDASVLNPAYSDAKRYEKITNSTPTNLRMISKNGLNVQFEWSGTGDIFAIYRKMSGTSDEFEMVGRATSRQINVNTINGRCDFSVAAVSFDGTRLSDFSSVVTIEEYLDAPTYFTATNVTSTDVTFNWNSVFGANRYALYRTSYGTYDPPVKVGETKNTTFKVPTVPGRYHYQVAVIDLEGNRLSLLSDVISVGR
ncbi:MAG TPA: M4 family metallopeptidase, partial [Chitinispirillaceae bacterium]|nr:M4 family metallopeptidase [Chitinispirillaceae bacterium]